MNTLTKAQREFFEELSNIQDYCVNAGLCNKDKFNNLEDLLNEVTCDAIYRVMESLDGYGSNTAKYNIVDASSGEIINAGIELHDRCVEFLKSPLTGTSKL